MMKHLIFWTVTLIVHTVWDLSLAVERACANLGSLKWGALCDGIRLKIRKSERVDLNEHSTHSVLKSSTIIGGGFSATFIENAITELQSRQRIPDISSENMAELLQLGIRNRDLKCRNYAKTRKM